MIRYRIVVSTPYHGEIFSARGTLESFCASLAAATVAVAAISDDLATRQLPVNFDVRVEA